MKKIVCFLMTAMALSACNKDEVACPAESSEITIVQSDILFDASGGTGTVKLADLEGAVTAVSASGWCQVSVAGDVVTVTADPNQALGGRASRITLKSGAKSSYVVAQQSGMEFSFLNTSYLVEMEGGTVTVSGASSFPVETALDVDWIKATEFDGGYRLSVAANDSGDSRNGTFTVKCGDVVSTYSIKQKFDRVFTGDYKLVFYTNSSKATELTRDVRFERDADNEDKYYISGISSHGRIPVVYNPSTEMLVIKNCSYIGPYGDNLWEYAVVNYATSDLASTYVSYSTDSKYDIYLTYTYKDGKYTLDLYDSAPKFNASRTSLGFSLYTFTVGEGNTLATANRKSNILGVIYPTFSQK